MIPDGLIDDDVAAGDQQVVKERVPSDLVVELGYQDVGDIPPS